MSPHFFINRPIFAMVLSIVICLVGGVAIVSLPIAQYPEVVPPTVQVTAVYPGASAEVVAETVATPIEQQVNGVENMLYMSSNSSSDGTMTLTITFALGTDLDEAQVLVQNRVAIAEPKLPEDVRRQGVTTKKQSPNLLLVINLISPDRRYDQTYLSNYALTQMQDELARLPGAGNISIFGARDYSMRVWLDPELMATRGITAGDVIGAIQQQNVQVAAGQIGQPPVPKGQETQLTINTQGRLSDPEEFANIVVKTGTRASVSRLRDIARVELGASSYDQGCSLDGEPSVGIGVYQLPGSNALAFAESIHHKLGELEERFPEGIEYKIVYDTTTFIEVSVEEVVKTLFEAILLVFLVVFIFLQNWRATLIPTLAVPVAVIGTFAIMALLGFTINTLTLFGLVLAIGIVVDDAIVVVENTERHLGEGLAPKEAAHKAMDEVTGPVVAIALVLTAVFVPSAFLTGITGQFYRQFALTIAASTIISAFNSLTLSPALCALLLKGHHGKPDILSRLLNLLLGWFFKLFNKVFDWTIAAYGGVVSAMIRVAVISLVLYGGLMYLTTRTFLSVPQGFITQQDQGYLVCAVQLPDGASLERTEALMAQVIKLGLETKGVAHCMGISGLNVLVGANAPNQGTMFFPLEPWGDRDEEARKTGKPLHSPDILAELRAKVSKIQDGVVVVFDAPPIQGIDASGGFRLQVQDRGNAGLAQLQSATGGLIAKAAEPGTGLVGLFTGFRANQPALFADVDRVKAMTLKVPIAEVFQTLQAFLGSYYINDFNKFGRTYQVKVQADEHYRTDPSTIKLLRVRNAQGGVVPLGTLVDIRDTQSPTRVSRYNMYSTAEINGMTLPGVSSGQGIDTMERLAASGLPRGFGIEWTGLTYQQIIATRDASIIQRPTTVFLLSVLFVFLVLAAQYESWFVPLAVILTVPLALLGAGIGLLVRGLDNSIFTQIGLVLLIGLGAKNAILIVEFARVRRAEGESLRQAAVEASKLRLRPILMTSFAFILGVVPLVWSHGAGAESRQALGTAVFSGMIASSLLGVLFTPVFFVIIQWINELITGGPRLAAEGGHAHGAGAHPDLRSEADPAPEKQAHPAAGNGEGAHAPAAPPTPAEPGDRPASPGSA